MGEDASGEETETQEDNVNVMPMLHAAIDYDIPDVSKKLRRLKRYGTL